ncbi:ribosomal protein [Musa troglodytarum]|uniref:Ribosomal protein n=1 Tax=Musa troglodytarum TaxID=320322 RepID=A0A9E7EW43_9LILI|nr:ribosomal protein [Musa troglodytarum]
MIGEIPSTARHAPYRIPAGRAEGETLSTCFSSLGWGTLRSPALSKRIPGSPSPSSALCRFHPWETQW